MKSLFPALALLVSLAGCRGPDPVPRARAEGASTPRDRASTVSRAPHDGPTIGPRPPSRLPAVARLVAIGDLHGDFEATRRALRLAGATDANDRWVGRDLVVVQVGDQLDRGDGEREILELLDRLEDEARRDGGALHVLVGNHEVMNAQADFRYVTPGGYDDFADVSEGASFREIESAPVRVRGRLRAFLPGGPWARWFASHPTVLVVGDTVFVHGGLAPALADRGLDAVNDAVSTFFATGRIADPAILGEDGPVWLRRFASDPTPAACAELDATLARLGVARMVVGHTVQEGGVHTYCGGRLAAIDVGLSSYYGGPLELLEVRPTGTQVLRAVR